MRSFIYTTGFLLAWGILSPAGAGMRCELYKVGSTPTQVLPANPNRTLLIFQNFSAMNMRCTDGDIQTPMVAGDPASDCPMGEGLVIPHIDPPTWPGGVGGYPSIVISGPGTPTGPIVCVHRVTGQLRSLTICQNE